MALSVDELWQKVNDAVDRDDLDAVVDLLTKLVEAGADEAAPLLGLYLYGQAIDLYNAVVNAENERRIRGAKLASAVLANAANISLSYLVKHPEPSEDANRASQVIVQAYDGMHTIASSGTTYGYRVIRDGYGLKDVTVMQYGNLIEVTREWEKVHEEYVASVPTGLSVFGNLDDEDIHIKSAVGNVRDNAKDTAAILASIGREYDADLLRGRMALDSAIGPNGTREHLLSAEWLIERAKNLAVRAFHDAGQLSLYQEWTGNHQQLFSEYEEMMVKFAGVVKNFKKKGQKPLIGSFFRRDETIPQLEESTDYDNNPTSDAVKSIAGSGALDGFLSVIAKISFKEYIPVLVMTSVVGLFAGGLIALLGMGMFGKLFGIIVTVLALIVTMVRAAKNAIDRGYESGEKTYLLFMLVWALLLSINWIIGVIVFVILKIMSRKYMI